MTLSALSLEIQRCSAGDGRDAESQQRPKRDPPRPAVRLFVAARALMS